MCHTYDCMQRHETQLIILSRLINIHKMKCYWCLPSLWHRRSRTAVDMVVSLALNIPSFMHDCIIFTQRGRSKPRQTRRCTGMLNLFARIGEVWLYWSVVESTGYIKVRGESINANCNTREAQCGVKYIRQVYVLNY